MAKCMVGRAQGGSAGQVSVLQGSFEHQSTHELHCHAGSGGAQHFVHKLAVCRGHMGPGPERIARCALPRLTCWHLCPSPAMAHLGSNRCTKPQTHITGCQEWVCIGLHHATCRAACVAAPQIEINPQANPIPSLSANRKIAGRIFFATPSEILSPRLVRESRTQTMVGKECRNSLPRFTLFPQLSIPLQIIIITYSFRIRHKYK